MQERIYLSPPYICGNEKKYVDEAFETNWIAPLGPNVSAFEKKMSAYTGIPYAVACSSGTAAIDMALRYCGVEAGDFVFCSSFTFSGSCNPIMAHKATPVFIDSEPETWNMSPDALREAFVWAKNRNKLPKAVIIVDLYGQSAAYDALLPICEEYGAPVVEDAAEALGARYKGKHCGGFGVLGVYSFNGNKIVTTSGGGMAVSNDGAAIQKLLFWATQAREPALHYEHKDWGYNYRLSNVSAGIGRGQLERLDHKIALRKAIFERYKELLSPMGGAMLPIGKDNEPNYWLSVAVLPQGVQPARVCEALAQKNVESRPAWKPMHLQPVFSDCPHFDTGVGERAFERGICLPSGEALTEAQQERIAETLAPRKG